VICESPIVINYTDSNRLSTLRPLGLYARAQGSVYSPSPPSSIKKLCRHSFPVALSAIVGQFPGERNQGVILFLPWRGLAVNILLDN